MTSDPALLSALVTAGFVGSLHCAGMCGGFALALDRGDRRFLPRTGTQLAFLGGKATTYVVLGALVGALGATFVRASGVAAARAVLSVVAGTLMVVAGLQIAGWLGELSFSRVFGPTSAYGRAVRAVAEARGPAAPFAMGALTGLLPCPLVYSFLLHGLATGSLLGAMGTMAILGGTSAPALLLVVATGALVSPMLRRRIVRVAGVVVIVLGLVTLARGLFPDALHRVFGHVAATSA
ncbi:MAG: sulfite exporter TauE/SafE family protein [Planctomycetia bacterium]|nr:sulfite exporter TauE/SafE family protein [Planctomycetia bacterium]